MTFGHNWGERRDIYRLVDACLNTCGLLLRFDGGLWSFGLFQGRVVHGSELLLDSVRDQVVLGLRLDLLLLLDSLKSVGTATERTGRVAEEGKVEELPVVEGLVLGLDWGLCCLDRGLIDHLAWLLMDRGLRNL